MQSQALCSCLAYACTFYHQRFKILCAIRLGSPATQVCLEANSHISPGAQQHIGGPYTGACQVQMLKMASMIAPNGKPVVTWDMRTVIQPEA